MNTIGEKRIRTEFNPSKTGNVEAIKQKTAELIDLLEAFKNDERNNLDGEAKRLVSIAQTEYESAAMWGVKAVTSNV
jgi:hypothetical protein